jgi:hypothetical protein
VLEFSGADLESGAIIRRDLPGVELFVSVERVTEAALPTELSGSFMVPAENAPFGFRPVYLFAREQDDSKVWTSPLFITFEPAG